MRDYVAKLSNPYAIVYKFYNNPKHHIPVNITRVVSFVIHVKKCVCVCVCVCVSSH